MYGLEYFVGIFRYWRGGFMSQKTAEQFCMSATSACRWQVYKFMPETKLWEKV